jgi:hypothetical protein
MPDKYTAKKGAQPSKSGGRKQNAMKKENTP